MMSVEVAYTPIAPVPSFDVSPDGKRFRRPSRSTAPARFTDDGPPA
jgi:hypothetical protein